MQKLKKILSGPEEQGREAIKTEAGREGNRILLGHFTSPKQLVLMEAGHVGSCRSQQLGKPGPPPKRFEGHRAIVSCWDCPWWCVQVGQMWLWYRTHLQRAAALL